MKASPQTPYTAVWLNRLSDVCPKAWNTLAVELQTPFLEWEWLYALEASGSAASATKWHPNHLTLWLGERLVGAAPLYTKWDSDGEFIYDLEWAELAKTLGLPYYPKMIGMTPFTPVSGYRFLIDPEGNEEHLTQIMVAEIENYCRVHNIYGCHFLFVDPDWRSRMEKMGYSCWLHPSFSWQNYEYQIFEDYLAAFRTRQRRNIKREREKLRKMGMVFKVFEEEQVPRYFMDLMHLFYEHTGNKFGEWGCKYLNRIFFNLLFKNFRHRLICVSAYQRSDLLPMGMSLFIKKGNTLYGRYWGSFMEIDTLHFNTCYYTPIEWAIQNGIQKLDPGVGGRHKIRRGFRATPCYSLHKFSNPTLRRLMEIHIPIINALENKQMALINQEVPFHHSFLGAREKP